MSNTHNSPYGDDRGKTDVAKEHAADLKDHAVGAGQDLGGQAKAEASSVVRDAKHEVRGLLDSVREESRGQLRGGQSKLAETVRSLTGEVKEMAEGGTQQGQASSVARSLASSGEDLANWIERAEPADVVDSVRRYASRNPMTFLALAAGAGLLVGRFARGFQAEQADDRGGAYDRFRRSQNVYDQDLGGRGYAQSGYSDPSGLIQPESRAGYQAEAGSQGQSWHNQSDTAYDQAPGDRR